MEIFTYNNKTPDRSSWGKALRFSVRIWGLSLYTASRPALEPS